LDISARGVWWNSYEKTFFNITITHPTSQFYASKLLQVYQHKKDKDYNKRIIDIIKSSIKSLFFTTGRMAPECTTVNKRLAETIVKNTRSLASVMRNTLEKISDL